MSRRKRGIQHVYGRVRASGRSGLDEVKKWLAANRTIVKWDVKREPSNVALYVADFYLTYGPHRCDDSQWSDTIRVLQDVAANLHGEVKMEYWLNLERSHFEELPEACPTCGRSCDCTPAPNDASGPG